MNYHEAMNRLRAKYGLSYTHNPGGGEFYCDEAPTTCQISEQDDKKDFERLVNWLRENEAEDLDEILATFGGIDGR